MIFPGQCCSMFITRFMAYIVDAYDVITCRLVYTSKFISAITASKLGYFLVYFKTHNHAQRIIDILKKFRV
jgi:hypothetical protein